MAELPEKWRTKLTSSNDALVTVRIEEEAQDPAAAPFADDPLFGMWRDREDMADVPSYVRRMRASRFDADAGPRED